MHLNEWLVFALIVFCLFVCDLFSHRKRRIIPVKEALLWSALWIAVALLFNLYIWYVRGKEDALIFLTGYLIEKALSIDNLFVFLILFTYFKTPATLCRKVLLWGVLGAIFMRAVFIILGITLVEKFHFIVYLLGAFLLFTGVRLGFTKKSVAYTPKKNLLIRFFCRHFPVTDTYEKDYFFVRKHGFVFATPLFLVLLAIETADVIFAIDSIPAILAITYDPFLVYTSNIFALLGLRSLYSVLPHLMKLQFLHYGIAFLLIFIGGKMLLSSFITIPITLALGVVFAILAISIILSFVIPQKNTHT